MKMYYVTRRHHQCMPGLHHLRNVGLSFAVKIFLIEQLTMPRRLRLFARHLQETVRHDDKLSLLTSLSFQVINDFSTFSAQEPQVYFQNWGLFLFLETKYLTNNTNIF